MPAPPPPIGLGARVYGAGLVALGAVCMIWGGFDPGQPVPASMPGRAALAYAVAALLIVGGAAVPWRRTATVAAAALGTYFAVIVVIVLDGRLVVANYASLGSYSGTAEQLAIAVGALAIYAATARIDAARAARLNRIARVAFGICCVLFGAAHFVYMNLTAPLVPTWLPPSQVMWGYATGAGFVAGGVALVTGVQARLAAILLTVMLGSFTLLVHVRMVLADPSHGNCAEGALNVVELGVAWIVADSLARARARRA